MPMLASILASMPDDVAGREVAAELFGGSPVTYLGSIPILCSIFGSIPCNILGSRPRAFGSIPWNVLGSAPILFGSNILGSRP